MEDLHKNVFGNMPPIYRAFITYIHAYIYTHMIKTFSFKVQIKIVTLQHSNASFHTNINVYINKAFETFIRILVMDMMLLTSTYILASPCLSSKYAEFIFVEHSRE